MTELESITVQSALLGIVVRAIQKGKENLDNLKLMDDIERILKDYGHVE